MGLALARPGRIATRGEAAERAAWAFAPARGSEYKVRVRGHPVDVPRWGLLKENPALDAEIDVTDERTADEGRIRIRCPLCAWTPSEWNRWCCVRIDVPERFTGGCGTVWNTFSTRGRCPGCQHQWRWTVCLSCRQWSIHEDWYEESS